MTVEQRFANCAREWRVSIDETRSTETSLLGFGARGGQPVVLKIIRKEISEEWRCGDIVNAFGGEGMIIPIAHAPGAVLLPRLLPAMTLPRCRLLRNPIDAPVLLNDPRVIERRLRTYEARLNFNADRVLKWAFATTVLAILWPADPGSGPDLRAPFACATHSMLRLLE